MIERQKITPSFSYIPQEETLEVITHKRSLKIGIPKETTFQENRVPLTPTSVSILVQNGHEIIVEHNAGEHSSYSDSEYSEAGAQIVYDKEAVFKASMIIKSAPVCEDEIDMLRPEHVIISPIHLPLFRASMLDALIKKKVIAITFDAIKDDSGIFPIVRSMSEIAGSSCILTAAKYLENTNGGKGILLGGISGVPPAKVVIIGAGVVGEFAARTAFGLGASIRIFDSSVFRLMRIQNHLGHLIYTSVLEREELLESLKIADVAVGALKPINGVTPVVVTEEMVSYMKPGSIIVDVSIDRGGCFETSRATTHQHPVFKKYDVVHYCVPNIASGVSRTASRAISNVLTPILMDCGDQGGIEQLLRLKPGIRNGVYIFKGCVTNAPIAKRFGKKYTDLELIMGTNPL